MIKRVHQLFFDFDGRKMEDFPLFLRSQESFHRMADGWEYTLWGEAEIERLCRERYPAFWPTYNALPYKIQQLDAAKYMLLDTGGLVSDLDVLVSAPLDEILGDAPYVFDRCSRKNVVANDFLYVGPGGLPGILDYFVENLARLERVAVYRHWKMRYIFQTGGPDFFTRYLKRAGLLAYVRALSHRTFLDPKERRREVGDRDAKVRVIHHLSWRDHVCNPRL